MFNHWRVAWYDWCCKRRYPDLYEDALQHRRLETLRDKLGGPNVAIVGNAQSVFDVPAGEEIDRCDVVIRINRGFVTRPECQGSRTDVLCLATEVEQARIDGDFGSPEVILVTPRRWTVGRKMLASSERLTCYPLDAWTDLSRQLGDRRPSAGLIAIDIALTFFGGKTVKLFGFDWKATKTYYSRRQRYGQHDWAAEKQLIANWAADGRVILPPRLTPEEMVKRVPDRCETPVAGIIH
ncbi:MAG: hypothetical protein KJ000_08255 [Pirellulaceae bacterium]|nr:hypothetical protein [Pirellulaceae bacterium]